MKLIKKQSCRVCGSMHLTPVISLGEQYLQGSFVKEGMERPPQRKIPLNLVLCDPQKNELGCGLLQMEHSVPSKILYSTYWYRSGTNNTMRDHLQSIVREITTFIKKDNLSVLDIGCNDGTLLNFYPKSYKKFGIDPSNIALSIPKNKATVVNDIFPSLKLNKVLGKDRVDIITSIAMFYDLENPIEFAQEIYKILSKNGVWIFEMSYMPEMLKKNSFDTICHEHLEYYCIFVIKYILKKAGFHLFKISCNEINGGSIRCFAAKIGNNKYNTLENENLIYSFEKQEFDLELDTPKPYIAFQQQIDKIKSQLYSLLTELKNKNKKIHIYGASTKGNTILQYCGIDEKLIDFASERNSDKFGARTLGTNIPIISEAESRQLNPDYYLVLPWHFKTEFLEREKDLKNKGTKFIFPLPEVTII